MKEKSKPYNYDALIQMFIDFNSCDLFLDFVDEVLHDIKPKAKRRLRQISA